MKLEQQVVSLELAQKLKSLGVKQESFFKYGNVTTNDGVFWNIYVPPEYNKIPHPDLWVHGISAFSVAELGEMLPYSILKNGIQYTIYLPTDNGEKQNSKSFGYVNHNANTLPWDWLFHQNVCDTEADARAKMLVYLLENKLITL